MPSNLFGLPTHILLLHTVVVLLPLAAIATVVIVLWPTARQRYGLEVLAFSFVATLAVPLTVQAGENLAARLPSSPAIQQHAALGKQVTAWAAIFGLCLAGVVLLDIVRRASSGGRMNKVERWLLTAGPASLRGGGSRGGARFSAVFTVVRVLAIITAVGMFVSLLRAGHSGAASVWNHYPHLSATPGPEAGG